MALGRSAAVVVGSFDLAESDRVVTFFSRDFGKIRGVARAARRMRSRFGSALELLTLGELVFFDGGRSDLVQIDHFDIVRPFDRVRDDLARLGQAAWIVECVARLTADRDPQAALYGLLVRALRSLEAGAAPLRVAVAFGVRCVDVLGHRLRLDTCVACGRTAAGEAIVTVDVEAGGRLCPGCARGIGDALTVPRQTVHDLIRLRRMAWSEALAAPLGPGEREIRAILEAHVGCLIGHPTRTSRFVREVERFSPTALRSGEPI